MIDLILEGGAKVYVDFETDKAPCKACRQVIYFAYTMKGKRMPICKDEQGKWVSHFSNCTHPELFRRGAIRELEKEYEEDKNRDLRDYYPRHPDSK